MKWTTKEGKESDIRDLETSHLENILKMLIKSNGTEIFYGGGVDANDMYFDSEEINNDDKIEKIELELRLRKDRTGTAS